MEAKRQGAGEAACLALMRERGLTLATAESCTGGLVAQRMTSLPGASAVFKGGVVSYWSQIKHTVLGVDRELLEDYGAVSPQVAAAMARGVRELMAADLTLSVTGVAGPDRDERGNPVGLVYVALAWAEGTHVEELRLTGDREEIRTAAADRAFDLLLRRLTGRGREPGEG